MAKRESWIITASGDRPLRDIAKELGATEFQIDQVLDEVGCIVGSASSEDVIERVRKIPGIADVSPDRPIDIGPPDSPVTW